MTIYDVRLYGRKILEGASPTPELDTDCIVEHTLGCDRSYLLFHREVSLSDGQSDEIKAYLEMRKTGLPVAYITGSKEFFGYDFMVTPDVLIPKPDTELLVEKALENIEEKLSANPGRHISLCDMCTGSGCVGLSIMLSALESGFFSKENIPSLIMADISDKALAVAQKNADALCQIVPNASMLRSHIRLVRSNLFEMVTGKFDIIVSNPPYIPAQEARCLLLDGRSEPILALDGDRDLCGNSTNDNDGLGIMRNLVPQAVTHLSPLGVLIVEAGEYNAEMTEYLFRSAGLRNTRIWRDLSGQLRDISGVK